MEESSIIKKVNVPRLSLEQLDMLVSYMEMEVNKDLRDGITNGLSTEESLDRAKRWSEIVRNLNSYGPTKNEKQWIQCWKDQKKKIKFKISKKKRHKTKQPYNKELTSNEQRILKLMDVVTPTVKEQVAIDNGRVLKIMDNTSTESVTTDGSSMEVLMIEDALMAEDEDVICSDESSHIEAKISPPTVLPLGRSLPEADKAEIMTLNIEKPSKSEMSQSGFVSLSLNLPKTGKQEENQTLSGILENLMLQNELLKRIAVVNEKIAHTCMTIASNSEKWRKENSLPTELIRDINYKLNNFLKQAE